MDRFGYFKENPYFPHPLAWFHDQETRVLSQIKTGEYAFASSVIVKSALNQRMSVLGEGIVKLEHGFLRFDGTLQQVATSFEIPLDQLISLPYRAGVNVEVAHNEKIYLFELEQGLSAVQWSISVEQWHRFLR